MSVICMCAITTLLSGCTKEPPKCSDEKTISLVKSIILDMLGGKGDPAEKDIKDAMKIEFTRATAYDKNIKKYSCEGDLIANDTYKLPITYESQLDDNGKHIVAVSRFRNADAVMVTSALANIKKSKDSKNDAKPQGQQAITISDNELCGDDLLKRFSNRIEKLVGNDYNKLLKNIQVSSCAERNGSEVIISGIAPHSGGSEEGIISINTATDLINIGILSGGNITYYSEDKSKPSLAIQKWNK